MTFRIINVRSVSALIIPLCLYLAGCQQQPVSPPANSNQVSNSQPSSSPQAQKSPAADTTAKNINLPVTLPVLDAMFSDESFAAELKSKLSLTDEQIEKLRQTARDATASLGEEDSEQSRSTVAAKRRATEQMQSIVGNEKAGELVNYIGERWSSGELELASQKPNAVPTDTRIVVNAPAYRMDVYQDGNLVRTYKVGIGYPEFPLPTGMRSAKEIIFNPTWTPPDEPWVKGKVKPFEKVAAGSKLNPLGPIKIPIGLPSLIHGGKQPAKLGTFASHGCVGLTDPQVQDFASILARVSGTQLTDEDINNYEKDKTETKNVKLANAMPIELRYETIVVEDGNLKIYRDVYEQGTNTEENLRKTLDAYGVSFDSLSEAERTQALEALKQMAVDAGGNAVEENANTNTNTKKNTSKTVTRAIKGKTEIDVPVAALKGKGYPLPVDLNTGTRSNKPMNSGNSTAAGNSNTGANTASNKTVAR